MTGRNRPARLNRGVLAVVGLLLATAGGFAVATHLGLLTYVDSDSALVPDTEAPPTWVLYVVAVVAFTVGTLMVRWLLAQLGPDPQDGGLAVRTGFRPGPYRTRREYRDHPVRRGAHCLHRCPHRPRHPRRYP